MTGLYILTAVSLLATLLPSAWRVTGAIVALACMLNIYALPYFEDITPHKTLLYAAVDSFFGLAFLILHPHGAFRMALALGGFVFVHCMSEIGAHSDPSMWYHVTYFYEEYEAIINGMNVLQAMLLGGGCAYDMARRYGDRAACLPSALDRVSVDKKEA